MSNRTLIKKTFRTKDHFGCEFWATVYKTAVGWNEDFSGRVYDSEYVMLGHPDITSKTLKGLKVRTGEVGY